MAPTVPRGVLLGVLVAGLAAETPAAPPARAPGQVPAPLPAGQQIAGAVQHAPRNGWSHGSPPQRDW